MVDFAYDWNWITTNVVSLRIWDFQKSKNGGEEIYIITVMFRRRSFFQLSFWFWILFSLFLIANHYYQVGPSNYKININYVMNLEDSLN